MCYQPTTPGLVIGGGYYATDRLADPTEIVTLVHVDGMRAIVRGASGRERTIAPSELSPVPPDELYRRLRCAS